MHHVKECYQKQSLYVNRMCFCKLFASPLREWLAHTKTARHAQWYSISQHACSDHDAMQTTNAETKSASVQRWRYTNAGQHDILLRKWLKLKFLYDCIGKRSQLLPLLLLFNLCGCYWGAKQWRMFKDLSFVLVVNSCTLWRFSVVSPLQHSCSSLDHFFMTSSLAPQVQHCACPGDDILSPCLTTFIVSLYHP